MAFIKDHGVPTEITYITPYTKINTWMATDAAINKGLIQRITKDKVVYELTETSQVSSLTLFTCSFGVT